jgi:hypothetical protein
MPSPGRSEDTNHAGDGVPRWKAEASPAGELRGRNESGRCGIAPKRKRSFPSSSRSGKPRATRRASRTPEADPALSGNSPRRGATPTAGSAPSVPRRPIGPAWFSPARCGRARRSWAWRESASSKRLSLTVAASRFRPRPRGPVPRAVFLVVLLVRGQRLAIPL